MQNSHSMLNANQQQKRSHHIPIEEVFTEHDINWNLDYDKGTGFNFNYPKKWLDAFSHRKMIGVRRLGLNPSAHTFDLQFLIVENMIHPKFTQNNWELINDGVVPIKPLIWEPGIHECGPIFIMSNDVYTVKEGYDELQILKRMYMIRYECRKVDDGYYIKIHTKESDEAIDKKVYRIHNKRYTILKENEIAEIMHKIIDDNNIVPFIDIKFKYDNKKCDLKIYNNDSDKDVLFNMHPAHFNSNSVTDDVSYFDPSLIEFLKFLNQPITMKNYFDLLTFKKEFNYTNIWDRKQAYIHSTFSDSRRGYIGLRNDFWTSPTKLYVYSNGGQEFYIRFTTDGKNSFLPIHSGFVIELVFIVDYSNVEIIN